SLAFPYQTPGTIRDAVMRVRDNNARFVYGISLAVEHRSACDEEAHSLWRQRLDCLPRDAIFKRLFDRSAIIRPHNAYIEPSPTAGTIQPPQVSALIEGCRGACAGQAPRVVPST